MRLELFWNDFFQNDESKWTLLRSCVKKETGCVPEFDNVKVKLVHMSKLESKELSSQVKKITCKSKVKTKQFKQFMSWLKKNGPFDVFIDTANVGIFSRNVRVQDMVLNFVLHKLRP